MISFLRLQDRHVETPDATWNEGESCYLRADSSMKQGTIVEVHAEEKKLKIEFNDRQGGDKQVGVYVWNRSCISRRRESIILRYAD